MKKKIALAAVFFFAPLAVGTVLLHGSKEHWFISAVSGFCSLLLIAIFWGKRGSTKRLAALMLFSGLGVSGLCGGRFYRSQIQDTKQRLEAVFPLIEEIKRTSGSYPENIDEFIKQADLPLLTRKRTVGMSRSDKFWVYFRDPNSGLNDVFLYDSNNRSWSYLLR